MTEKTVYEKMAALASKEVSGWLEDAKWRIENEGWLKHSQYIALTILRTLRAKKMSQKALAERIGVSPQQISKIVKGGGNLTLETIAKIESALGIPLIEVPFRNEEPAPLPDSPEKKGKQTGKTSAHYPAVHAGEKVTVKETTEKKVWSAKTGSVDSRKGNKTAKDVHKAR